MMKKKHFAVPAILLLLFGGTIYAMTSVEVSNHLETDQVKISLKEYQVNGSGEEEKWKEPGAILPADEISKILRISNEGADCYVRAKVNFRENGELDDTVLYGIGEDWIKAADGYYYRTEILSKGESTDFFQGLLIPEDFSQTNEDKKFYMEITADAIQSSSFLPEFHRDSPWGSVEILSNEKEETGRIRTLQSCQETFFTIRYEGGSQGLVVNSEDFFAEIPALMPGDSYGDTIKLLNDKSTPVKFYFRSAADGGKLAEQIRLKITVKQDGKEQILYYGNLQAEELLENRLLGTLEKGAEGEVEFRIEVPAELDNEYLLLEDSVKWIFSAEPAVVTKTVKTGDGMNPGIYLAVALGACGGFLWIGKRKNHGKKIRLLEEKR